MGRLSRTSQSSDDVGTEREALIQPGATLSHHASDGSINGGSPAQSPRSPSRRKEKADLQWSVDSVAESDDEEEANDLKRPVAPGSPYRYVQTKSMETLNLSRTPSVTNFFTRIKSPKIDGGDEEANKLMEQNEGGKEYAKQGQGGFYVTRPKDNYRTVYFIFFMNGLNMLLPWNLVISSQSYTVRLAGTALADTFLAIVGPTFQVINITALLLVNVFAPSIPVTARVQIPLVTLILCVGNLTLAAAIDAGPTVYAAQTLVSVVLMAFITAFLQSGLFGLAGFLPFRYTQAVMGGQGLGGMLVSIISVVSLIAGDDHVASIAYYGSATGIVMLCWLLFTILPYISYMKHQLTRRAITGDLYDEETTVEQKGKGSPSKSPLELVKDLWTIVGQVKLYGVAVMLTFMLSLSLFPTVGSSIHSSGYLFGQPYAPGEFWVPIYTFIAFNTFDFIGRQASSLGLQPRGKPILLVVLLRFALIPLLLLCRYNGYIMSPLANDDAFPALIMIIIGLTNGYFGSVCMILGPSNPDIPQHRRENAGSVMVLLLTLGITLGTTVGSLCTIVMDKYYPK